MPEQPLKRRIVSLMTFIWPRWNLPALILLCASVMGTHAVDAVAQQTEAAATSSSSFPVVDTIIISGNMKTKASVILREMTLKPGMPVTEELIEYDKGRIYSLGLFNRVDIFTDSLEGVRFLLVDVSERWYLIPVPLFGFRDGDTKRLYLGGGLLHNNFRGLNQKLFGSVVFGADPSLALFFADPEIDHDHNFFFSGNLSFARIRNKSDIESALTGRFDELHYGIDATIGKRFSLFESAGITLGYEMVEIASRRPGRTVASNGTDRYIWGRISYSHDTRDIRTYASRGHFVSLAVTKNGLGESEVSFTRLGADVRQFTPLPSDLTLAARVHGSVVSGGVVPTYARSYFGYGEKLRGYSGTVREGENIAGGSLEIRWPLLKPLIIHFSALPLPEEFAVWRFGISLAAFADAGTTWFRGQKLQFRSLASGYGAGVHFLLPYDWVVRTEFAWNEYGKGEFILDLRTSF